MSETQKPSQGKREGGNGRPRNNRNRNNRNRNRNRNNNRNRAPKPLKLTFWQKVLKAIGLFDEEKARKKQQAQRKQAQANKPKTAPKSNVRNAKTDGGNKPKGQGQGQQKSRRRAPQPVAVDSARLYVGNLSYDATEQDIQELFKGVGTVKKVEIIYNRNTHKSKGYGFVQMLNKEEAERAVDVLHDQPFLGRQLVVNGSKSRKDETKPKQEETITIEE